MSTWFTSDLHFLHGFVAKIRGFDTWQEHDEQIIANINSKVQKDDELWILGDLSLRKIDQFVELLDRLNGHKYIILGNHCLDETTRALTKRGLITADQIREDDEFLTVTPDGSSEWQRSSRVIYREYSGPMVSIQGSKIDFLGTPEHRVVYQAFNKNGIPHSRESLAKDFNPNTHTGFITSGKGSSVDSSFSDDDIRLLAWMMTDSGTDGRYWTFYQSENKSDRIESLLSCWPGQYTKRARKRDIQEICGKRLKTDPQISVEFGIKVGELNDHLWSLAEDKDSLPEWVWSLSESQVDVLVDEWKYTDGSTPTRQRDGGNGSSLVLYCSRDIVRHQLMSLMVANGYRVSEVEYRPGHWKINAVKRLVTHQSSLKIEKSVQYDGRIWCITVPNGQFFVERGGKVYLTGNCTSHPMNRGWLNQWKKLNEHVDFIGTNATIRWGGHTVFLQHFPTEGDGESFEDRCKEWRLPIHHRRYLIHGHTHRADQVAHGRMYHVGLDAHGLMPVNEKTIRSWIDETDRKEGKR